MAREQHFAMLENQLVADLIDPDSRIMEDELPAVMLTEDVDQVRVALTLLNEEQRFLLANEAQELINNLDLNAAEKYQERISLIKNIA
jgi:hypothetical protein